jgi:hypothetical protein
MTADFTFHDRTNRETASTGVTPSPGISPVFSSAGETRRSLRTAGLSGGDSYSTRHVAPRDARFVAQNTLEKQVSKRTAPSRKGMGPTSTSWKPGTSGNPGGRPRRALAAVDAVREKVDPNEWVEAELTVARDMDKPWDVRRDAWRALIDRGFVKAPAQLDAHVTQGNASGVDVDKLSLDDLRQITEVIERSKGESSTSDHRLHEPSVSEEHDGSANRLTTEEQSDESQPLETTEASTDGDL